MPAMRRTLLLLCALALAGCDSPTHPRTLTPRSYRMGFSAIPPTSDFVTAFASLELWTRRADGAIFHVSPPWEALLAGVPADTLVRANELPLANYYRGKGLDLVVTIDLTDGLNRAQEAPPLVAAGRTLAEPAVQQALRNYAVAIDTLLRPSRLGIGAETNLIRVAAPPAVYAAVVQAANAAASEVRFRDSSVRLYVSVQVEVAWNRFAGGPLTYVGVAQDLVDFPFAQDIGLSSFPPQPPGSVLPLFTTIGLVDTTLAPKPALAEWDATFARPRE
jgi:hypothetical protein